MADKVWHRLGADVKLRDGKIAVHALDGWQVLLVRYKGELVAINDRCTYATARFSTGRLQHGAIICPLHGARFELASGRCIGDTYPPVRQFALRVADGMIEVAVPADSPGWDETPTR